MALAKRHFRLILQSAIVLFHVTPNFAETLQNTAFRKLRLCTSSFAGTESVSVRSSLECAAHCDARNTCMGFSYFPHGTCSLHKVDLTSHTCAHQTTSTVHFQKESAAPSNPCQNGGQPINNNNACQCFGGYVGDFCERLMIDCTEGLTSGHYPHMSGMYLALPVTAPGPIQLQCDTNIHHVMQKRWLANVAFNLTMQDYVTGFGTADGDYWMGLENAYLITSSGLEYNLGVQVTNVSNDPFYQHYYINFKVKSREEGYAMTFTSHTAARLPAITMGDCLSPLQNLSFSTYDVDNDSNSSRNCAAEYGGGWWYGNECSQCNLMGELRWNSLTRVPGSLSEVFWLPGMPADFSPASTFMFLFRL